ncbi:MAG: acyltransferase [Deltaproteobacteria bacterium]|nr:acyltransferase [Deltaproteobacteria bacterium]
MIGTLKGLVASVFLFLSILLINFLQMASVLVLPFSGAGFRAINRWFANTWWSACVFCTEKIFGIETIFTGDHVPSKENAIVVANHQSMADIVAIFPLGARLERLGDMKWFVKDVLKYVPGVGWGMLFLDCIFLKRDWLADRDRILKTFSRLRGLHIAFWLISFVEGTRNTPEKLAQSQAFARANGLRVPSEVLIPRTKGFTASMLGLRSEIVAVYDLTIGYEGGVPTLWRFLCGKTRRVHLHVRRFPVENLPMQEDELARWLMARFEAKDQLLTNFRKDAVL